MLNPDSGTIRSPKKLTRQKIFLELLEGLPAKGKDNLVQDVISQNDKELEELGHDVKMFMFSAGVS